LQLLLVDLDDSARNLESYVGVSVGIDSLEELVSTNWDDTSVGTIAELGVRLSRAGLSVGEESGVEATPCLFKHGFSKHTPDFLLVNILVVSGLVVAVLVDLEAVVGPHGVIEDKGFILVVDTVVDHIFDDDFSVSHVDTAYLLLRFFFGGERSDSHSDLDGFSAHLTVTKV